MLPSLLMAAGSIILAWRVKSLIDVLMMAQRGAETNFKSLTEFLAGRQDELPTLIGLISMWTVAKNSASGFWFSVFS